MPDAPVPASLRRAEALRLIARARALLTEPVEAPAQDYLTHAASALRALETAGSASAAARGPGQDRG